MAKDKSEVNENGRPSFYACLYSDFRRIAVDNGYALAIHGSMADDMDLLAVAWTDEAIPHKELVSMFLDRVSKTVWKEYVLNDERFHTHRPHGRISYSIPILGDVRIDLSIIPPNNNKDHVQDTV